MSTDPFDESSRKALKEIKTTKTPLNISYSKITKNITSKDLRTERDGGDNERISVEQRRGLSRNISAEVLE